MSFDQDSHRRGVISQLNALVISIITMSVVPAVVALEYNTLIDGLRDALGPNPERFQVPREAFYGRNEKGQIEFCDKRIVDAKVRQAAAYLQATAPSPLDAISVRAGTLFSSLRDADLKARCEDLLSAPGNFDRAINQATQVLEDRIRRKSGAGTGLTGVELVNKMIKANPDVSPLIVSRDPGEQDGFANVCRGVMLAFRNQTHHELTDKYSREDALKVCAFIDLLLFNLENAVLRS